MHRSFRYLAFAGSSVLSCVVAYKLKSTGGINETGVVYAAGKSTAEILRSSLANNGNIEWNKNWDFREPSSTSKVSSEKHRVPSLAEHWGDSEQTPVASSKPTAVRHLVFIRHGQYVKADEDENRVLTYSGRQQAETTGKRLQSLNMHSEKTKIDKIVISTMTRAKETGDIIRNFIPDVPYEYCDFLREGAPCRPEPQSSTWKPENHEVFQDSARIEAAFRRYIHRADPAQKKDSVEVYVCHANVIRYFVCRALQFPPEGWLRMNIGNCGITWITISPNGALQFPPEGWLRMNIGNCGITWITISPSGRVSLRSMGDTGHLSPNWNHVDNY